MCTIGRGSLHVLGNDSFRQVAALSSVHACMMQGRQHVRRLEPGHHAFI